MKHGDVVLAEDMPTHTIRIAEDALPELADLAAAEPASAPAPAEPEATMMMQAWVDDDEPEATKTIAAISDDDDAAAAPVEASAGDDEGDDGECDCEQDESAAIAVETRSERDNAHEAEQESADEGAERVLRRRVLPQQFRRARRDV